MTRQSTGVVRALLTTACAAALAGLAWSPVAAAQSGNYGFATSYVDSQLAGGEPLVLADPAHGTLIYTSHEGTTHLYRNGLVTPFDFGANYRNQVNVWTSPDNGASWFRDDLATFQGANPAQDTGFSDPDLTQDEGGRVYDTGIDLANDALFASVDGGKTFDKGTAQCHDGDRPWLAGAGKDTAFMATDTVEGSGSGHEVFKTTNGGNSCDPNGVPDNGAFGPSGSGRSFTGFGKLYFDHQTHRLIEPALFSTTTGSGFNANTVQDGVGVSVSDPQQSKFTPHEVAKTPGGIFAHWPAIALDSADNIYLVWDTNERAANSTGGCGGSQTPLPNSIQMAVSRDLGQTWSAPITISRPANARVFWPWLAAGTDGNVNIVWYQTDKVADPDCQHVTVSVEDAFVTNAASASPSVTVLDPVGRPIHRDSTVCQGGTSCVATGQDRRLGDFLTNSIDANGCVMIATGDTTKPDALSGGPRPTSLPLFVHQNRGPSLTGGQCGPGTETLTLPGQTSSGGAGASGSGGFALGPGGVTASCFDREAPKSRFRFYRASRRRLFFRGGSRDIGCVNRQAGVKIRGRVVRVRVAVGREVSHRRCRFLHADGSFSRPRSCFRTSYLPARGTSHWRFVFRHRLPRGVYKAWVRGIDAHGNIERKDHRRNFIRFHVK